MEYHILIGFSKQGQNIFGVAFKFKLSQGDNGYIMTMPERYPEKVCKLN